MIQVTSLVQRRHQALSPELELTGSIPQKFCVTELWPLLCLMLTLCSFK